MFTLLKYGVTKNLGDYNSERIDAEYAPNEAESPTLALKKLKKFVSEGVIDEEEKKEEEVKKKAPTKKKVAKKETLPEPPKEEEVKGVVEEKIEEELPPKKEDTPPELPKEEVKKKAPAKKKPDINYDRSESNHKAELAKTLKLICPDWKTTKLKEAQQLSKDLVGKPIYNAKGDVLESFIAQIKEVLT